MYQRYQNREAETVCVIAMCRSLAKSSANGKRRSADRGIVRVKRAQQVLAALRRIAMPQRAQLGDRRVVPVHAQVHQREACMLHHLQVRAAHRTILAAGSETLL